MDAGKRILVSWVNFWAFARCLYNSNLTTPLEFARDDIGVWLGLAWPGLDGWTGHNGSFLGQVSDNSCTKRKAIRAETASAKETRHSEEMRHQACKGAGRGGVEVEEITLSGVVRREKGGRFLP